MLIDVRPDDALKRDPHLILGSLPRPVTKPEDLLSVSGGKQAVVICENGGALSQGIAAWLRHAGVAAETLEGGFAFFVPTQYPAGKDVPNASSRHRGGWGSFPIRM